MTYLFGIFTCAIVAIPLGAYLQLRRRNREAWWHEGRRDGEKEHMYDALAGSDGNFVNEGGNKCVRVREHEADSVLSDENGQKDNVEDNW